MQLHRHPEYTTYLVDCRLSERARQAAVSWRANDLKLPGGAASPTWTVAQAEALVRSLQRLLVDYNRVLFEEFPYCPPCRGQCCLKGGAGVSVFDALALALLEAPFPDLPERIEASEFDCIYRSSAGCLWPPAWRTLKCWVFYCSGTDHNLPVLAGAPVRNKESLAYPAIARRLQPVVRELLPVALTADEGGLLERLDTPLRFAEALGRSLQRAFVTPFTQVYPLGRRIFPYFRERFPNLSRNQRQRLRQIARQVESLYRQDELPTELVEQCLAELEELEMDVLSGKMRGLA